MQLDEARRALQRSEPLREFRKQFVEPKIELIKAAILRTDIADDKDIYFVERQKGALAALESTFAFLDATVPEPEELTDAEAAAI